MLLISLSSFSRNLISYNILIISEKLSAVNAIEAKDAERAQRNCQIRRPKKKNYLVNDTNIKILIRRRQNNDRTIRQFLENASYFIGGRQGYFHNINNNNPEQNDDDEED